MTAARPSWRVRGIYLTLQPFILKHGGAKSPIFQSEYYKKKSSNNNNNNNNEFTPIILYMFLGATYILTLDYHSGNPLY
jgi:hypothetical protein